MKDQIPSNSKRKASEKTQLIAMLAILSAMSIVLGKFIQIPIGNSIRISFENLPILFAGIIFGPAAGAAVGAVEDVIGCFLAGFPLNPVITLGSISVGFLSGLVSRFISRVSRICRYSIFRIGASVFTAHLVGSVLIKSAGLYLAYSKPIAELALRIPIYLIANTVAESAIIFTLLQSGAVCSALKLSERTLKDSNKNNKSL